MILDQLCYNTPPTDQVMFNLDVLHRHETPNLLLIIAMVFLVPLIWWLVPGWNFSDLLNQHDNLLSSYIFQREMGRAGGDWAKLLYWPQLAGGAKVHDITGSLPFVQLLAWAGAAPLIISNFVVFFMQILFAYFCTRITIGLSEVIYDNQVPTPYLALVLLGILFAFLPLLGWRLPYGHINIISGVFVFLCFICLFLEEITGRRSITSIALCALTLTHTFQHSGYQMIHYSLVFGSPIIISLTFAKPGQSFIQRSRWYLFPALVFLGAFLISLPKFYGMLTSALGGEMGRSDGVQVIYSYTTASVGDWLSSLPWSKAAIPGARETFLHHEVNYPLGPLALLLILSKPTIPFGRLAIGLGISLFLAIVISMNIAPFSTWMVSLVPMLESFRVPARAVFPFLLCTSMLGAAALLKLITTSIDDLDNKGQFWLLALVSVIFFAFSSSLLNDVLLALFILFIFVLVKVRQLPAPFPLALLALLTGAALSAFSERSLPPLQNPISEDSVSGIRGKILEQAPDLASPLNRVHTDIQLKGVGFNSLFFMDFSSLSSYWFPLRRYAELVAALNETQYHPTTINFHHQPSQPGFRALNRLYNVGSTIYFENGQPRVEQTGKTWGPSWLSTRIANQGSLTDLALSLKEYPNKNVLLLLNQDPFTRAANVSGPPCKVISEPVIREPNFPINLSLAVEGQCWLTVSMNYSTILNVVDQDGQELVTFPAYGALLGILPSENTRNIIIRPMTTKLPGSMFFSLAGFLVITGLFIYGISHPFLNRKGMNINQNPAEDRTNKL